MVNRAGKQLRLGKCRKPLGGGGLPLPRDGRNFTAIGDSITTTGIDEVDAQGWPGHLRQALDAVGTYWWSEKPVRFANGGYDVADTRAGIDAYLLGKTDVPVFVAIYLGANDVTDSHGWPLDETTWKANYRYILDALHVKWPSALLYLGKSYRNDAAALTRLATVSDWIDALVTEQSYYRAGLDGRDVMTGHAEYLSDEVHPNHAGCVALASAWVPILGY